MHSKVFTALALILLAPACKEQAPTTHDAPAEKADAKIPAEKAPAKSDKKDTAKDPHAKFDNVSIDKLASMIADDKAVAVDANDKDTRDKYGIVPGALLLSDATDFETSELPDNKSQKLVFYCGSERCTAAPKAAAVAKKAGYDNVSVMRAGIRGWVDAGQKVDKPTT